MVLATTLRSRSVSGRRVRPTLKSNAKATSNVTAAAILSGQRGMTHWRTERERESIGKHARRGTGEHERGDGDDRERVACKPRAPAAERQRDGRGGAERDHRRHRKQ